MRSFALILASLATAFVQAASAQEVPGRVGRLAYTQGPVSVYQDPEFGWDKAYVNTPITSENSVWTDRGARAEMRVGGTAVRLDGETQLDVSRLDDDVLDATIQRGSVNLRVRYKERNDHVTFATPHALFNIETDGRYRIDVDEDRDESRLTVFGGYAFMEGSSGRVPVEPGRTVIVSGAGQYDFIRAGETAFDRWAAVRDQQWQDSNSRRYVSYDMTGYEELDRYGNWSQDADYGAIWYPTRVAAGWTPYRDGHWTYIRPWGYTWVDDAPWGYAPSHYGRWVQVRDRWGWIPGSVRERPVWAPALVGFIGGAGFSVGISTGSPVGWYPLAPWERYDPWYRASPTYVTRVNRYVVDRAPRWYQGRDNDWRSWNRERAATVVNRDVFVNRRAVQGSLLRMNPEALRQASAVPGAQVVQQVLPQRNEVLRYREQNRVNVAAPVVTRERRDWQQRSQQQATQPQQPQQQAGQVVQPEFRRRFGGAPPVAIMPAPSAGQQPPVSAPAPQAQPAQRFEQQPQNPAARMERAQQRQAEDAARAAAQQQQLQEQEAQRAADRATRDRLQSDKDRGERAAQRQAEEAARAAAAQQNARDQQRAVEAQRQQQGEAQRAQQEQAQRAAREAQQQQERAARENQQQQQRQSREAQQAQERAQREAQQQQQQQQQQQRQAQERAARDAAQQQQQAADLQRKREEAAQRAARDTQAREQAFRQQQEAAQRAQQQQQRAQPQPAPQPPQAQPQPPQAQPQPAPQANPAARGDNRGRGREKDDKDEKDKEKDKDKR